MSDNDENMRDRAPIDLPHWREFRAHEQHISHLVDAVHAARVAVQAARTRAAHHRAVAHLADLIEQFNQACAQAMLFLGALEAGADQDEDGLRTTAWHFQRHHPDERANLEKIALEDSPAGEVARQMLALIRRYPLPSVLPNEKGRDTEQAPTDICRLCGPERGVPGQAYILDVTDGERWLREEVRVLCERHARVCALCVHHDPLAGRAGRISVSVLDAGSGTVRRTIPLGKGLSMMALDDRAGRVFVVSDGRSAPVPDTWGWLPAWLRRRLSFLPPLQPRPRIVPPSVTVLDSATSGGAAV